MAQEDQGAKRVELKARRGDCMNIEAKLQGEEFVEYTKDGSVDLRGCPATKKGTGGWVAGSLILVNQGLATLAFFGVGVNLVLFLTRVLQQSNADAANNVSKWTGTVYIFSLVGAFLSDSCWGRYKTCAIFQVIYVFGLVLLSLSSQLYLLEPKGCGDGHPPCGPHSTMEIGLFYLSIYMVALGYGGYQPNIATFGADQFEECDPKEGQSKVAFFSYFYLALNLGSLFSNTVLSYFQDHGSWPMSFWASTGSASAALLLFLAGTLQYRHFKSGDNPLARVSQVVVAATRKCKVPLPTDGEDLYEIDGKEEEASSNGLSKRLLHTDGFKFLDRAAIPEASDHPLSRDPWRLCTVTQVEELKVILRLIPIWLCTVPFSVVFTQMASLFVVQGAAMNTAVSPTIHIPPASMSAFDILSVAAFIFLYRHLLRPLLRRLTKNPHGLTELQRMGAGLAVAVSAMASAGAVERRRLAGGTSIMWQVPQYALIGVAEVFMYVGQLEFFNGQAPEGLKSFGSALCMASMSFGNYVSDLLVTVVMKVTAGEGRPGWIPANLDVGHLDWFYFLLAGVAAADLVVYVACARWYRSVRRSEEEEEEDEGKGV